MIKKKITIIICCFNYSKFLTKCLNSVFNQSISKRFYDVILIDDKSSDNSLYIAKNYKKYKNYKIIKNKINLGLVKSCNKAIKKANSEFIIRVDSDDYISKNFVKFFLREIKNKYDFIFSDYSILQNRKIKKISILNFKFKNLISCSVAFKKRKFNQIGGYKNFMWEEYDLYFRYLNKTKTIKRIKKNIYFYRHHQHNMTGITNWKIKAWKELYKIHTKKKIDNLEKEINKKIF